MCVAVMGEFISTGSMLCDAITHFTFNRIKVESRTNGKTKKTIIKLFPELAAYKIKEKLNKLFSSDKRTSV